MAGMISCHGDKKSDKNMSPHEFVFYFTRGLNDHKNRSSQNQPIYCTDSITINLRRTLNSTLFISQM